ncbi:MAG: LON peptidase substrate-binding domain-containing protein, partial [Saprospiraceae bacterium]|nr:LON peptidase substrate-binding domain-containing protein [Saprospiraceae bacterium]
MDLIKNVILAEQRIELLESKRNIMSEDLKLAIDDEGLDFLPLFDQDEEDKKKDDEEMPDDYPLLALKNTVLFPGIVIPVTIGREKSIKAINTAYETNRLIGVITQKQVDTEDPMQDDLYTVGVVARILKILKMPDGTSSAILKGQSRFKIEHIYQYSPFLRAKVANIEEEPVSKPQEMMAIASSIKDLGERIIQISPQIPTDAAAVLSNIKDNNFLTNFVASNLNVDVAAKQELLEMNDPLKKAEVVLEKMDKELQLLQLKDQIESKVRGNLEKQQRDYFLNQQLKTIQDELGNNPQALELEELEKRAKEKVWSEEAAEKFAKDFKKVKRTNPAAAEYSILVNYLELLLDLPWGSYTQDNFDLNRAEDILNKDHFGLDKVKDRILEHLAVLKLRQDMKSPILCLVGPPGVGKTSLGKSIAAALERKYIRMSLGGLHDESELRGHRKTYIGAMPGRLIQSLKKAGASN